MAKVAYQPPKQGFVGMVIDSFLMLVLVFCALEAPGWIAEYRAAQEVAVSTEESMTEATAAVTWEELGQNATMQFAWEALDIDPTAAEVIINDRFDYTINVLKLLFVIVLLVVYFGYMLTKSNKEFKEVISEKFD